MASTTGGAALELLGLAAGKGRACPASLRGQRRRGASGGFGINFLTSTCSLPAVIWGAAFGSRVSPTAVLSSEWCFAVNRVAFCEAE